MKLLANKLKKGDIIGIVAPSKPVINADTKEQLEKFIAFVESKGLRVKLSENLYKRDKYDIAAGTPKQRADDINAMFADNNVQAIWCLQGGEPADQVLDLLDYSLIEANPKLFMGKSDIDVLTVAIHQKTGLVTFHCCDTKIGANKEMDFEYTKRWFEKRLFEGVKEIEPSEEWSCVREGSAEGRIMGCNTGSILKLAGTQYFPDFTDTILFVEMYKSNVGEIVRHFTQLKNIGALAKIKGIVIGHNFEFTSEKFTVEEVIRDLMVDYDVPILKINEFGHYQPHAFLPIGARVAMDATNKKIWITEEFVL